MGVGGPAPPAGFPPAHCRGRPARHRGEVRGPGPRTGGYLETGNALRSTALRFAEPSQARWSTPSDERRKYFRDSTQFPPTATKSDSDNGSIITDTANAAWRVCG